MSDNTIQMMTEIVANFVTGNKVAPAELPSLIRSVFRALSTVVVPEEAVPVQETLTPAQIRKSIGLGGLVSFEDGETYKTLKWHLGTRGLTDTDYESK